MNNMNLAILGGGNMGRALSGGLLRRGMRAEHLRVVEPLEPARAALARDFGITATPDILQAVEGAGVIVLAVKPQHVARVLADIAEPLKGGKPLVISIAAGLRIATLTLWCGEGVPVLRAMPNRPALVGAGATGLFAPATIDTAHRALAERVMSAVGEVVWVPTEDALDAVTALSGSGPAYLFLVAELMAQAGTEMGLAPETAQRLAVATLHGAGLLAQSSGGDLARLRAEVTSPAGTTEAAVRALEAGGLRALITTALKAAAARSRELDEQLRRPTPG